MPTITSGLNKQNGSERDRITCNISTPPSKKNGQQQWDDPSIEVCTPGRHKINIPKNRICHTSWYTQPTVNHIPHLQIHQSNERDVCMHLKYLSISVRRRSFVNHPPSNVEPKVGRLGEEWKWDMLEINYHQYKDTSSKNNGHGAWIHPPMVVRHFAYTRKSSPPKLFLQYVPIHHTK